MCASHVTGADMAVVPSTQPTRRQAILCIAGSLGLITRAKAAPIPPTWDGVIPLRRIALLDNVQRRACSYFYEQAHPETGLVLDRVRIAGSDDRRIASIAATGFGLTTLCIGARHGYLTTAAARDRVETTLDFFAHRASHENGFFYHFVDAESGDRVYRCEISSIDTTWLLCGILHARQFFGTPKIRRLASEILDRVDWRWMLAGGSTLSHGWTPEHGFLPYRWDQYSELLGMYLLALGSKHFAIPPQSWDAWKRPEVRAFNGEMLIASTAPLFVHQYSHGWFDFRHRRDHYANYFENSRIATLEHRKFCLGLQNKYPWIDEHMWGVTASESRTGYTDWRGPDGGSWEAVDGTLVPSAAGGSLVFLPDDCSRVLDEMFFRYRADIWTRYGFVNAFNPGANWFCPDVLGIDLGIVALMAENLRDASVWRALDSCPEVHRGFAAAGFTRDPGTIA